MTICADGNVDRVDKDSTLRMGTLADAMIIDAPSSTMSKAKAIDTEMSSAMTTNIWYPGIKVHTGVNADSAVIEGLETSTAKL